MASIPLAEAQDLLLTACASLVPVDTPLSAAGGLVLAEEIRAPQDVPPFDNTAMDGYALRSDDAAEVGVILEVIGTVAAGRPSLVPMGAGQAMRIMTGAPIPDGADAVIMVESTEVETDGKQVRLSTSVRRGDHIRLRGSDIVSGEVALRPPTVLGPSQLGLLASLGVTTVKTHPRPRVGVMSTGDELVDGNVALQPGQIRDSNRIALLACLTRDGFAAIDFGIVADDEAAVRDAIELAMDSCDAVITSGGVSVGDFDCVKKVVLEMSQASDTPAVAGSIAIAIKPAKPFAYGFPGGKPILGLPGNPVSSLVSYELLARPVLRKLAGHHEPIRKAIRGRAGSDFSRLPDGRVHYVRVAAGFDSSGRLAAQALGHQASHHLATMALANGLAVLPDGDGLSEGAELDLLLLDGP